MGQAGLRRHAAGMAAVGAAMAAVCGCAGPEATTGDTARLPPLMVVPGSLLLPAPGVSRPVLRDTCGAAALAGLVGKPRTLIPVPVDLSRRRVACTACPVAPDVRLDRVNILFDARTGLVTRVACG